MSWILKRLLAPIVTLVTCVTFGCAPVTAQPSNGLSTGLNLPLGLQVDQNGAPVLFAALKGGGLLVLDISDPMSPRAGARVGRAALGGMDAMNLHQVGSRLYVALGDHFRAGGAHAGLAIIDVGQPNSPRVLGIWKSRSRMNGAGDVTAQGNTVWLGAMSHGVITLDVTDPSQIAEGPHIMPDRDFPKPNPGRLQIPAARGLFADGDRLYVANDAGGLHIFNIADPTNPIIAGRHINRKMGPKPSAYNNLIVREGMAFVAIDYCGVEIIDVRNPRKMQQVGWWNPWNCQTPSNTWFNSGGHTNQIAWVGQNRLAVSGGDAELLILDVSNPNNPVRVGGEGGARNGLGVWSIARAGQFGFLGYIRTPIPFNGRWTGIRTVPIN